ncbi:hypothetical protein LTR94_031658, partial [Friedmanniomyces endolithicus]
VPRRRHTDDQLPPAQVDALHARQRLCRRSRHEGRLRPRCRDRLSVLLLWRRQPALSRSGSSPSGL